MLDIQRKRQEKKGPATKKRQLKCEMTLSRFLISEQRKVFGSAGEFTLVMDAIQRVAKQVSSYLRYGGIFRGLQTNERSLKSYECKKIYDTCELVFFSSLCQSTTTCLLASNNCSDLIDVSEDNVNSKYVVTFVSVDGCGKKRSSSVAGSIFSIYRRMNLGKAVGVDDLLQYGRDMLAAGYILFGPRTILMLAPRENMGVYEFTLNPVINEFVATEVKVRIPSKGLIYSMDEGRVKHMNPLVVDYITKMKEIQVMKGKPLKCKYSGSLVADFHSVLKSGGLLLYPNVPQQKRHVKLLFHCNPLAFILEEAGGLVTSDGRSVLDILPRATHQLSPFYGGSPDDLEELAAHVAFPSEESDPSPQIPSNNPL